MLDQLFDALDRFPDRVDDSKWVLELFRKSERNQPERKPLSVGLGESSIPREVLPCNFIRNLYFDINFKHSFDDLMNWISSSNEVKNLLMAIEAFQTWFFYRHLYHGISKYSGDEIPIFTCKLLKLQRKRNWKPLPPNFMQRYITNLLGLTFAWEFDHELFCYSSDDKVVPKTLAVVDSRERFARPISVLSEAVTLTFHFKIPSTSSCHLPGECGFLLKTVPASAAMRSFQSRPLKKLILCTEEEDYRNQDVHFHKEIKAENMHAYISNLRCSHSLSWLGWLHSSDTESSLETLRLDWEEKLGFSGTDYDLAQYRIAVAYYFN